MTPSQGEGDFSEGKCSQLSTPPVSQEPIDGASDSVIQDAEASASGNVMWKYFFSFDSKYT